jgi:hypothetical protein
MPYTKVREVVELPKSRKALVATFESILESGKVQKVIVEVGKPIIVEKYVEGMSAGPPVEEVDPNDYFMAARNAEIIEISESPRPLDMLLLAFEELYSRGLRPKVFLARSVAGVIEWLELGRTKMASLLGVELVVLKDIPADVVLLLASLESDPDVVTLSIRIPIPAEESTGQVEARDEAHS